jgi:hypothetical protein
MLPLHVAAAWRVGRKLGRTLYLDDRCVGMLDDPELARAVVDGLMLLDELDELGEGDGGERWRVRLVVWRLRVRALRLEALRRRRMRGVRPARGRVARR